MSPESIFWVAFRPVWRLRSRTLQMRDSYDETEKGFAEWKAAGDVGAYDWGDHLDVVRAAVARGVAIRRIRVVSEPLSDYLLWEHACRIGSTLPELATGRPTA
jgi:hypothetical protein